MYIYIYIYIYAHAHLSLNFSEYMYTCCDAILCTAHHAIHVARSFWPEFSGFYKQRHSRYYHC